MNKEELELVKNARKNAHEPYCNFKVGAILVTKTGKKYSGCNISNHALLSICAERVAFVKALSEGEKEFSKIMVIGGKDENSLVECLPCGYCRQFMSEFVGDDFLIETTKKQYTMKELLPYGFKL